MTPRGTPVEQRRSDDHAVREHRCTPLPVIVLPWPVLVPDNRRIGMHNGRGLLTARYRRAKGLATALFVDAWGDRRRLETPVALHVRVFLPDRRRRDVGNLRKLVTDALEAAKVVADDTLIHDERWTRVAVDRANPRAELTITPLREA